MSGVLNPPTNDYSRHRSGDTCTVIMSPVPENLRTKEYPKQYLHRYTPRNTMVFSIHNEDKKDIPDDTDVYGTKHDTHDSFMYNSVISDFSHLKKKKLISNWN